MEGHWRKFIWVAEICPRDSSPRYVQLKGEDQVRDKIVEGIVDIAMQCYIIFN